MCFETARDQNLSTLRIHHVAILVHKSLEPHLPLLKELQGISSCHLICLLLSAEGIDLDLALLRVVGHS